MLNYLLYRCSSEIQAITLRESTCHHPCSSGSHLFSSSIVCSVESIAAWNQGVVGRLGDLSIAQIPHLNLYRGYHSSVVAATSQVYICLVRSAFLRQQKRNQVRYDRIAPVG